MAFGLSAATVGLIGAGVSVASGFMGANAAGDAADAQLQGGREANATQKAMYDQTRTDNEPYRLTGVEANNRLATLLGLRGEGEQGHGSLMRNFGQSDMDADPVYNSGLQFGLDEGRKGLERQASAGGGMLSGATLKALTRYGNDYASTKANDSFNRFQTNQGNQFNRLSGISGTGQTAVNQISGAGQNYASTVGANQIGMGNARAASSIGQSNAITGAIGQGYGMYQGQQYMDMLRNRNNPYASAPTSGNYLGAWDGD